MAADTILKKN